MKPALGAPYQCGHPLIWTSFVFPQLRAPWLNTSTSYTFDWENDKYTKPYSSSLRVSSLGAERGKTFYLQVCPGRASKAAVILGIRHSLLAHEQARGERLAKL